MKELHEAYEELYCDTNIPNGYRYNKRINSFSELSHFIGMRGKDYCNQSVRFLLVGRAVNGWRSMDTTNASAFADQACELFETDHFDWIEWDDEAKRLRNDDPNGYYWLNKSPFWRMSEDVWRSIPSVPEVQNSSKKIWTDYIAWTNLYKIAPKDQGNPTQTMSVKQLGACRRILKAEITLLKPTHILFLTGYRGWFEDFREIFDADFSEAKENKHRNGEKNNYFVETYAITAEGTKIIVACRPDQRDERAMLNDIKNYL